MKRSWIGLALFSASWLFGLSYYHDANWWAWAMLIVAGSVLLKGVQIRSHKDSLRRTTKFESVVAAVMLLPAIYLAPWPYRMAPLLIFVGLSLSIVPIRRQWPKVFSSALILAGVILTVQSLAMLGYEYFTARTHELTWPWPGLLFSVSRLLGTQAALDGTSLALFSPRRVHCLGATWELLLDPATLCFLCGGIVMLCLWTPINQPLRKHKTHLVKRLATLVLLIAAWLPFRTALLISIFIHRALRTSYDAELALMNQFWNPWLYLAFLSGPILLSLRFVHKQKTEESPQDAYLGHKLRQKQRPELLSSDSCLPTSVFWPKHLGIIILTFAGSVLLIMGLLLDMPGRRKEGRVMVHEYHSTWERTDKPFDTNWYGHDSGYNYACIYDYCSRFYDMSRLEAPIDDATMQNCDVLVVKVPTERYDRQEIEAIRRFVERGGGLLLVGEHTSVFNTGIHLNDIAKLFGFSFRYDCLFDIDTIFTQLYHQPLVPHPIVQNMPKLNFAVSCSINPGKSLGRAVIRSTGLMNLMADYHASNFYPQVEDRADVRYGAFVQLWTTRYGAGRVAAFTDSTIFSNFSTFEPGKPELMLGMLEWLNHRNFPYDLRPFLIILGLLLIAASLVLSWHGLEARGNKAKLAHQRPGMAVPQNVAWLIMVCAGLFGWAVATVTLRAIHQHSMGLPKAVRPMVQVVVDRTVCDAPLSKSGFISGKKNGFAIFERWILRLGYFTSRKHGSDALTGDLIVFTHPNLIVTDKFRDELVNYVTLGGKVLILDSPANVESTANSLLYPFGLTVKQGTNFNGLLKAPQDWPVIRIDSTCQIEGGQPILWVVRSGTPILGTSSGENVPIAATVRHGKGTVTVIGFGSRFADAYMGVTGDVVPDDELRKVFDVQFLMLKTIISKP